MKLPVFKYHPDPFSTGNIKQSAYVCIVCDQSRGYIYTGPVYARGEYVECICPWCIADGSAHKKLNAHFTDIHGIGLYRSASPISQEIKEVIAFRTPGFAGWQQERWFTHCNDGAAFLGAVGYEELQTIGHEAIEAIHQDTGLRGEDWENFLQILDRNGSPTAYLFQCLHCKVYGGYQDCD
jgi:uncharacterized protein